MMPLTLTIVQTVLMLASAPLMVGILRKCKARLQNRRGASVLQPYWILATLLRKEMTVSTHASWMFHVVPFVYLAGALVLALVVPTLAVGTVGGAQGNAFVVAAVLALGAVFLVLGGMDTGSTFGNMGASREMTLVALVEPVLITVFAALGFASGSWTLDGMVVGIATSGWLLTHPFLILTIVAYGLVVLAENARYPVDNPATHLELTMVHEAMVLEYSGPYLALIEYAGMVKLAVLALLLTNILYPAHLLFRGATVTEVLFAFLGFALKFVLCGVGIALLESVMGKMRFYRMQEYVFTAYLIAFLGFIFTALF